MRTMFVKLFISFWLAMTLSGVVFAILVFNMRPDPMHESMERLNNQQRKILTQSLLIFGRSAADAWEKERAPQALRGGGAGPGAPAAYLFTADGTPLSPDVPPPLLDRVRELVAAGSQRQPPLGPPPGPVPGMVTVKVASRSGTGYLAVAEDRPAPPPEGFPPHGIPPGFWVRFAITFVCGALVCYGLAWHLTSPVRQLRVAAQSMAKGDLAARVPPPKGRGGDELSDLGRDFNRMAEQMEKLVSAHRQLVRDVSHELRSPLARLSVALELCRKAASPTANAALDRIELETARLNQLIGELLVLSRLEGGGGLQLKELELNALLDEVARDADFEASGENRRVSLSAASPVVIQGDRELLRRALENVVRNAVRYTPEGSEVAVRLEQLGGRACVRVLDHGPGVPEAALGDIFKPFFRVAESRDRRSGGTGIGLAITERTVVLHGGTVSARNVAGAGLEVEITLPVNG